MLKQPRAQLRRARLIAFRTRIADEGRGRVEELHPEMRRESPSEIERAQKERSLKRVRRVVMPDDFRCLAQEITAVTERAARDRKRQSQTLARCFSAVEMRKISGKRQ